MVISKTYSNILVRFKVENEQDLVCKNIIYIFTIEGDEDMYWYVGQSHYGLRHRMISHCSDCWRRSDNNKKSNVMRKYRKLTARILYKCKDTYEMDQKEREYIKECYKKHGPQCLNTILLYKSKMEPYTVKSIDDKYRIEQYDLKGNYMATFASIRDAANKTGARRNLISRVVNHRAKTAGGFQWKRENDPTEIEIVAPHCNQIVSSERYEYTPQRYVIRTKETPQQKKHREQKARGLKIMQYDLNGTFIAEHPSLHEAERKTSVNIKAISNCCRGIFAQSNGFQFRYKGSDMKVKTDLTDHRTRTIEFNVRTKGIGVVLCDRDKNIVYRFDSINQARKALKISNIKAHLDTNEMWHNYYWHTL